MGPSTDKPDDELPFDDDPASESKRSDLDRPLLELLGIKPNFAPDELAPPVDEHRLADFIGNQMPRSEWMEMWELVTSFRSWYDAWRSLLRSERKLP